MDWTVQEVFKGIDFTNVWNLEELFVQAGITNKVFFMCTQVNGCMCGLKVKGISCCKRWVFQTDNPSLDGMLSQLQCGQKHRRINPFGKAPLKDTGKYPDPLGKLFVLSLMLRWSKDRDWVV